MADQTIKELSEKPTFILLLLFGSPKIRLQRLARLKDSLLEEQTYMSSHFTDVDANFPFSSHDGIMTIAKS